MDLDGTSLLAHMFNPALNRAVKEERKTIDRLSFRVLLAGPHAPTIALITKLQTAAVAVDGGHGRRR